jgi:hypothetical protein
MASNVFIHRQSYKIVCKEYLAWGRWGGGRGGRAPPPPPIGGEKVNNLGIKTIWHGTYVCAPGGEGGQVAWVGGGGGDVGWGEGHAQRQEGKQNLTQKPKGKEL